MGVDVFLAEGIGVDEPDADREPLSDALKTAGIRAEWRVWGDPDVDWGAAKVCYPRATWDYHLDHGRFLAWTQHVSEVSKLRNSAAVIGWNSHKRYLSELAAAEIPVVPTVCVARGTDMALRDLRECQAWARVVIKPAVSCGSWETYVVEPAGDGEPHWSRLVAQRDMLVQPFVDSVTTTGERSAIVVDGEVTHVIRKNPRFHGDDESIGGPFDPSAAECALIEQVLRFVPEPLDYARVDMVADHDGKPMVAELELIEPSLFFPYSDLALRRFVTMVERQIQQA